MSAEERREQALDIMQRFPGKLPIYVDKKAKSNAPDIDKHKFLVPSDLTMAQFIYILRKRVKLTPEKAIFVFVDGKLAPNSQLISELYKAHKAEDEFLYITYCCEATFG